MNSMTPSQAPVSEQRVSALYELRKDSARPDHREIAAICADWLRIRALLREAKTALEKADELSRREAAHADTRYLGDLWDSRAATLRKLIEACP